MNPKNHWEKIYRNKSTTDVSWYQSRPSLSLEWITNSGIDKRCRIIDIGGGASTLVDHLLDNGFENITVLDISSAALEAARSRLGSRAQNVTWLETDITQLDCKGEYDLWHDRAVFHFLTQVSDRKKYIEALNRVLKIGGHLIIATFALDGPKKCSGLDIVRYSAQTLCKELGKNFKLIKSVDEIHVTPAQVQQKFVYCHFIKMNSSVL